jgi:Fe-S-cluster formation regulator IscX/YfhJ
MTPNIKPERKQLLSEISQALVAIDPKISYFNYIMERVVKLAECSCDPRNSESEQINKESNDKS